MMYSKKIDKIVDERGWLAEILRKKDLSKRTFGQLYISVAKPGMTKGNHYHKRKTEWFCVIKGYAELVLVGILDKKEETIYLKGDELLAVSINPNIFHKITNVGSEEMVLLVYSDEVFDPRDPDTFCDI